MVWRSLRNSLIVGLLSSLALLFFGVPIAESMHSLYLSTDWTWAYYLYSAFMAIGALAPWYDYGLHAAFGFGAVVTLLWFFIALLTLPFRRRSS